MARTGKINTKTMPDEEVVQLSKDDFDKLARDANAAQEAGITDDQDIDADELSVLREMEGASQTQWKLWKTLPLDEAGHVATLPSAALDMDNIARKYGPGKYRVRGRRSDGTWTPQRTIEISPVSVLKTEHTAPGAASGGVADVLAILRDQKNRESEKVKEWLIPLVTVLAPGLLEMFRGLFARKPDSSLTEMVAALQGMKALADPPKESDPLRQLDQMTAMIERVRGILPEKESTGSTWVDLVRDVAKESGPILSGLISMRAAQQAPVQHVPFTTAPQPPMQPAVITRVQPQQPATVSAPASAEAPAPQETQTTQENPMLALLGWLRNQLPMLTAKAAANSDPGLYAELLLDNLPQGADPQLIHMWLSKPEWWDMLKGVYPPMEPYRGWFTQMRDALIESVAEELREQDIQRDIEVQSRMGNEMQSDE
jgi:hypothetical protein